MPLVSLALWTTVAEDGPIGRFGGPELVGYFLGALVVRQVTGSWLVWEMSMEVKSGALSRRLLKPIHPLVAYSAENIGAMPMRAAISLPIAIVAVWLGAGDVPSDPVIVGAWVVSLLGAWLINFFTMALMGTLSFYFESATAVFQLWLMGFMLLSGYLVPLELLPGWARSLAAILPFRYTLAFPVEAIVGLSDRRSVLVDLCVQWAYVAASCAAAILAFRRAARRFSAVGA
jgi:ABC-2 type transport system permease protein